MLIKVADEANAQVTLYGQEKDATTAGLAYMNMVLHNHSTAMISQGNTIADPKFKDKDALRTFDYVVANPPFSDKRWSTGIDPLTDSYERFKPYGVPPAKQGDYAYLLHIIRSLKSQGKGACILPHGVLFRGNAEAEIRRNLIRKGYIKGIIGLPANLFYGTGIPACIIVIDKENADQRKAIFMIDASSGFMKDGNKNRLRAQDIHKIVDVFNKQLEVHKYSRIVPIEEIERNEFNLNIPRYIDSQEVEDIQDIGAHLHGGIPAADIDALTQYWEVCPRLNQALFKTNRPGYYDLILDKDSIKSTIFSHPDFVAFTKNMSVHFEKWRARSAKKLMDLQKGFHPKALISELAEDLLNHYAGKPLIDKYHIYQHLMDYWAETMQDDCYLITEEGWKANTYRIIEKDKKGKEKDKGWACDLVPRSLVINRYFTQEQQNIDQLLARIEDSSFRMTELEEENGGDEGVFAGFEKINKAEIIKYLKEIRNDTSANDEISILNEWLALNEHGSVLKKQLKNIEKELDTKAHEQYEKLNEEAIKTLVVNNKWLVAISAKIRCELDSISQALTQRVKELAERYEETLPELTLQVTELENNAHAHLEKMGFSFNTMVREMEKLS